MFPAPPPDACLFLDVDGTLLDIAATPDAVRVPPGLMDALSRAERSLDGALALISGRSIAELDRIFAPLRLKSSGVHGAEFCFGPEASDRWIKAEPLSTQAWTDLLDLLRTFPTSLVENKGFSFAVHYRAAPETGPALRAALDRFLAERSGLGLSILTGHFVFELKRPGIDKGAAIADFMDRAPFRGRRPIFIGDDVTDEPGFRTVTRLGGSAYSVSQAFPGVLGTFADPAEVRHWLSDIGIPDGPTS
ncbi:MAG: trehalose-phosphatase [Janthinobacterium lividum]